MASVVEVVHGVDGVTVVDSVGVLINVVIFVETSVKLLVLIVAVAVAVAVAVVPPPILAVIFQGLTRRSTRWRVVHSLNNRG